MANPPPSAHNTREHSQVTSGVPATVPSTLEFAETTTVSLEWRLTGLRAMYESSKGDAKSKCIKSAIFGDPDHLWEVLWYPNSGAQGGDHASLYLACMPTLQERELAIGNKWVRKGTWFFRFEVKVSEERTGKMQVIASKDASDHTFAAKTGNWGWQQFAKRDALFLNPAVVASDSFTIVCTISCQPQPPAGYWLGLTVPRTPAQPGTPNQMSWAGGEGASVGVGGGTRAAGGPKRVVPRELISSVGDLFDDPLYSDIEFVIVPSSHKARLLDGERPPSRKVYANKRLLNRCEYFEAMFHGGFREVEGVMDEDDIDYDDEALSDSDQDDELEDFLYPLRDDSGSASPPRAPGAEESVSPIRADNTSHPTSGDASANVSDGEGHSDDSDGAGFTTEGEGAAVHARMDAKEETETPKLEDTSTEGMEVDVISPPPAAAAAAAASGPLHGPKKTRIIVRDAAWATWWAVLYWLYTDTIYFAPLASSFMGDSPASRRTRSGSLPPAPEPRTRREWIAIWLAERGFDRPSPQISHVPPTARVVGPRPVSAKGVYRLADRLDLPALRLRAFQHINGQLTSQNIPAEVFSRFSSTFEEVRKVQVAYFLKHWGEIKKSDTMQNIWKQIRDGKHVGFEDESPGIQESWRSEESPRLQESGNLRDEGRGRQAAKSKSGERPKRPNEHMWPLIVSQLDFRPA